MKRIITSVIALSLLSTMTAWGQTSVIKREQAKQKPQVSKAKPQNSYTQKHFTVDSIEYYTRSAKEVLLYSVKKKVNGHFVIPEKVSFEGKEYTVVAIGDALQHKKNLKEVTIPSSLKELGSFYGHLGPFCGDTALTAIRIAPGNTTFEIVEHGVLMNKATKTLIWVPTHLTGNYEVPVGTRHINKGAFEDCRISSVTMPSTVEDIGSCAFSGCHHLEKMNIPNSVKTIGHLAFDGCSGLTSISLPDGITTIASEVFFYCKSLSSITIPTSVKTIKDEAFRYCKGLTEVHIPNSVTEIGTYAFSNSGIKSVSIPNSVVTLKDKAFMECDKLETIVLPSHLLSTLEKSVFYGCKMLKEITLRYSDGTKKKVPVEEKWMNYAY